MSRESESQINLETSTYINMFAQGKANADALKEWFESHDDQHRRKILANVVYWVAQSHPSPVEVRMAATSSHQRSFLMRTRLLNSQDNETISSISEVPQKQVALAFQYMANLFGLADSRRRKKICRGQCHHPWHNRLD